MADRSSGRGVAPVDKAEIARCQRKMAALATIETAWEADQDKPRVVAAYLKLAAIRPHARAIVDQIAASMGDAVSARPAEHAPGEALPELVVPSLRSPPVTASESKDGLSDVGVMAEAERVSERRKKMSSALDEGRTQLQELVAKGLERLIPGTANGLIQPFLDSLEDTIAEKVVDRVYPDTLVDLQSAVLWAQLQRTPEGWQSWDWKHLKVPPIEHVAPVIAGDIGFPRDIDAVSRDWRRVDERTDAERIVEQFSHKIEVESREAAVAEDARLRRAAAEFRAKPRYEIEERLRPREVLRVR
jgi:hypothetical protein